jgi:hypothetical protein
VAGPVIVVVLLLRHGRDLGGVFSSLKSLTTFGIRAELQKAQADAALEVSGAQGLFVTTALPRPRHRGRPVIRGEPSLATWPDFGQRLTKPACAIGFSRPRPRLDPAFTACLLDHDIQCVW